MPGTRPGMTNDGLRKPHKRVDRDIATLFDRANDERIDFGFDNAGIADSKRRKSQDRAGETLKVAPGPATIAGQRLERCNLAECRVRRRQKLR